MSSAYSFKEEFEPHRKCRIQEAAWVPTSEDSQVVLNSSGVFTPHTPPIRGRQRIKMRNRLRHAKLEKVQDGEEKSNYETVDDLESAYEEEDSSESSQINVLGNCNRTNKELEECIHRDSFFEFVYPLDDFRWRAIINGTCIGSFEKEIDAAVAINEYCKDNNLPPKNVKLLHDHFQKHQKHVGLDKYVYWIAKSKCVAYLANKFIGYFKTIAKARRAIKDHLEGRKTKSLKGVHWCKRQGKWLAQFYYKGVTCHVGAFHSQIEAAQALNEVCEKTGVGLKNPNIPPAPESLVMIRYLSPEETRQKSKRKRRKNEGGLSIRVRKKQLRRPKITKRKKNANHHAENTTRQQQAVRQHNTKKTKKKQKKISIIISKVEDTSDEEMSSNYEPEYENTSLYSDEDELFVQTRNKLARIKSSSTRSSSSQYSQSNSGVSNPMKKQEKNYVFPHDFNYDKKNKMKSELEKFDRNDDVDEYLSQSKRHGKIKNESSFPFSQSEDPISVYEGLKWCKKLNRWNCSFYHDEKYYFTGLYGSEHDASISGNDKCKALRIPLKFELKKKQIGKKLSSSSNDTILLNTDENEEKFYANGKVRGTKRKWSYFSEEELCYKRQKRNHNFLDNKEIGKTQLDSGMLVSFSEDEQQQPITTYGRPARRVESLKSSTRIRVRRNIGKNKQNSLKLHSPPHSSSADVANNNNNNGLNHPFSFSRCPSPPPSEFYDSLSSNNVTHNNNHCVKPLGPMLPQEKLEFLEQSSFLQSSGLQECFGYGRQPVEAIFFDVDDVVSSSSTCGTNSLSSSQGGTEKATTEDSSSEPILDLLKDDDDDIIETDTTSISRAVAQDFSNTDLYYQTKSSSKYDVKREMATSPSPPGENETHYTIPKKNMNDEVKHKRRMNIIDAEFKISCLPECSSPSPKENLKRRNQKIKEISSDIEFNFQTSPMVEMEMPNMFSKNGVKENFEFFKYNHHDQQSASELDDPGLTMLDSPFCFDDII